MRATVFRPDRNCPKCWKNATCNRKKDDDSPVILPCYISPTTPTGCSVSHTMHHDIDVWLELAALIGPDTSIAQALPLLDRAEATEEDYDILLLMRAWRGEAEEERRRAEQQKAR